MKIDLDIIQLNNNDSLFLAGKNFGNKIQLGQKNIKEMYYDTDSGLAIVVCEGYTARIRGFLSVVDRKDKTEVKTHISHPMIKNIAPAQVSDPTGVRVSAQVETPMQKVQGTPGRKPKYQGQEV